MNAALKEEVRSMCALIDSAGDIADVEDMSCAARIEMAKYLMYLSASDGEIKLSEAAVISEVLDFGVDTQWISSFIREHNVYSVDFENTCPPVFMLLVILDNDRYSKGTSGRCAASEMMLELYKKLGVELLLSDGRPDDKEKADFGIFIGMLNQYLNDNLLSRNAGTKVNFTK